MKRNLLCLALLGLIAPSDVNARDLTLYLDIGTYDIPVLIPMVRGFVPAAGIQGVPLR